MSDHVEDYLRLRRALGFKLHWTGHLLPQFITFLESSEATTVTVDLAVAWALSRPDASPLTSARRLNAVRGFTRYLQSIDPTTEIPPAGLLPAPQQRRTPYIYSPGEVSQLLAAARGLRPRLRAAGYEALLGLLAATGMRLNEAITLARGDVDLTAGVITVRHAKFDRVRLVPLHPSVTAALRRYVANRDVLRPQPRTDRFFLTGVGTAWQNCIVDATFERLTTDIGLRTTTVHPRVHDLRHTLAVRTLIDWQRDDVDVRSRLPVLSAYLGHVNPAHTYWYLTAVPELMQLAASRLDPRPVGTP